MVVTMLLKNALPSHQQNVGAEFFALWKVDKNFMGVFIL